MGRPWREGSGPARRRELPGAGLTGDTAAPGDSFGPRGESGGGPRGARGIPAAPHLHPRPRGPPMHELEMAKSMVRLMEQAAAGAHARRVSRACLRVGELAGLDPGILASAFVNASHGTVAEGCVLEVRRTPALLRCRTCGTSHGGPLLVPCPVCGDPGAEILDGREAWIESLDVDPDDRPPPGSPA